MQEISSIAKATHGIATGDVTDHSAIIWGRAGSYATMFVEYGNDPSFSNSSWVKSTNVNGSTNFIGQIKVDNLIANSTYFYRVWFANLSASPVDEFNDTSEMLYGQFKTAPLHDTERSVSFVIGGDLGGHQLCRRINIGYHIFEVMRSFSPDFFVFNGDQVYADHSCPYERNKFKKANMTSWHNIPGNFSEITETDWNDTGKLHETFLKHWIYNRADPHLQRLLQSTSMYSQADDHEVINDYGGSWGYYPAEGFGDVPGFNNLVKTGLDLFFEFSPIDRNKEDPNRIYRAFNWGAFLDLFLLDSRSYRSMSHLPESSEEPKTLYGEEQLDWLKNGLLNSNATWKVISSDVPITVPNCFAISIGLGCDNWATNTTDTSTVNQTFVMERLSFLKFLDEEDIKNVIFLAADAHFATNIRIEQDFDNDGDLLEFHEMVSGPLNDAFHNPYPRDPTLNSTYLYTETGNFNFGHIEIVKSELDEKPHFKYKVVDANNFVRPGSILELTPK